MGKWDIEPWDDDKAADWFADLFERTKLAQHVEAALNGNPNGESEKIRAAASLLIFLGRPFVWPIDDLNRHLALAADRLEEVARLEEAGDLGPSPELVAQIRLEIEELRSRIKEPDTSAPQIKWLPKKKWWQFWQ
jgi:hypothetical protein